MLGVLERSSTPKQSQTPTHDTPMNPPAFLDLADSAARLSSNLPDINARIEQKRQEHQHQRELQRRHFEDQMRALEAKQAEEEKALLLTPVASLGDGLNEHIALSAPTTPPRNSFGLSDSSSTGGVSSLHHQVVTNGLLDYSKRSSVNYSLAPNPESGSPGSHNHTAGAKSMPGSRRGSSGSHDNTVHDMTTNLNLSSLSLKDSEYTDGSSQPQSRVPHRSQTGPVTSSLSAASLFDQDLDNEMTNSLRHLPTQTEDERVNVRAHYARKLSVSSNALDLAPLQQSRPFSSRITDSVGLTSSEWPQFSGPPRPTDLGGLRLNTRSSSHNLAIGTDTPSTLSVPTPIPTQSPDASRKSSPPTFSDVSSLTGHTTISSARSVPATPLTNLSNSALRVERGLPSTKTPGGPVSPSQPVDRGISGSSDLANSTFSRVSPVAFDTLTYNPIRGDDLHTSYASDPLYLPNNTLEIPRYGYGAYTPGRLSAGGTDFGSPYQGSRYGMNGNTSRFGGMDSKMSGLGGPKHRRGDIEREFNRFAGARLEDLQGDIPALCKDQHGCRYLQKKLEEGSPEHRDIIFRETYAHLSDLMTDPFGNYLCQKLLEYSTDEQRTLICEAVAQDLVQISLNMHGTRAVQKMIDFLSTQRQSDPRYDAQIRTIIVALSQHVVTLIKDLNGNHVVQKCLNRLAPEDNQFIYNAVAAHCVEVATHRHGCCVLQRCVDHASDAQRVQLVTEITFNALTLVQDPYGNYVVQYILDLNDNRFSDAVIRQFLGNVCALSVQKFSSNVIEKCIRVAEHTTRKMIIEELLNRNRLEKLLRDSFGNYCVQTALDYAEPGQRMILVEGIRPILPLIRNTPYGKRIQSKLQREHVEAYGGSYTHSNLPVLPNGPRHHVPPASVPYPRSASDPYHRSSPYTLAQNGAQLHTVPSMHNMQQHLADHSFPNSQISGSGLTNQPSINTRIGTMSNGFSAMASGYGAQLGHVANGFVGVTSSPNDHYLRSQYSYAM